MRARAFLTSILFAFGLIVVTPSAASADVIEGWDTNSCDVPTQRLSEWPWSNNTGLWRTADREALTGFYENLETTADGQCISARKLGNVTVKHANVTIKLSDIRGMVLNQTTSPVKLIYNDMRPPTLPTTCRCYGVKGLVNAHRVNAWGYLDFVFTAKRQGIFRVHDSFVHDLNRVYDPGQRGASHNDGFQVVSFNSSVFLDHNTWWMSGINNYDGPPGGESATRNSGPGWTNNGNAIASTCRYHSATNTALMVGRGSAFNPNLSITANLFRGCSPYYHLNIQNGTTVNVDGNTFYTNEMVRRTIIAGRANVDTFVGNVDQNGNPLTL